MIRAVALGALVAAGYYLGATVGLALRLPHAIPSVMWPPNAILTSALLLTPWRWWPAVLLSALPPHVVLEHRAGFPIALVLALFVTNCGEALIAAGGMHWLSDSPTRFDSLRRVTLFLAVVVLAAPLISSFFDAAAVWSIGGEPYWRTWTARSFSNSLTELTVVPAVVMVATSGLTWLRTATRSRHAEAGLFAAAVLVVGSLLHGQSVAVHDPTAMVLTDAARLVWFLPLLVWAALRLGPAATSVGLLVTALSLVSAAVRAGGPFRGLPPSETTLTLQAFLIPMAVAPLIAAALVQERRVAEQDTRRRLAFEALLAQVAGAFVHLPSNRMRAVFTECLRRVGEFLALDWLMLLEQPDGARETTLVAAWTRDGADPARPVFDLGDRGAAGGSVSGGGIGRRVAIPLVAQGQTLGVLMFPPPETASETESSHLQQRMHSIARVLATALFRERRENALRASETMKSAILESLTKGVVVLDRQGRIIAVNQSWLRMAGDDAPPDATRIGGDYIEFYRAETRSGSQWAAQAAAGIEAVMRGERLEFHTEQTSSVAAGDRTIAIRAAPLRRREGGAVVTHTDISHERRAEREAHRARAALAHVTRVSTMGALTGSIAHQLNQPLTAILANAQAAFRFLAADPPDLDEVRTSLEDIVVDDRRAGQIIARMRGLLRRDEARVEEVDLNALVRDAAQLVNSDATLRNVALMLQLDSGPAVVRGDQVQLEQVLLNLIVNALEATSDSRVGSRRVVVRSKRDGRVVEVSVADNGPGFSGANDLAFEEFYTTKPGGIGLGLSIARSIVQAHSGAINTADNPGGGAIVSFRLPLVEAEAGATAEAKRHEVVSRP